jgi:cysteine desulfuration protein SufE
MSPSLAAKRDALLETLGLLPDSYEKFTWLVDYARKRQSLPDDLKIDAFRVDGCLSAVWLVPALEDGVCQFRTDSDSAVVKGMAWLLCDLYSGESPAAVLELEPDFLEQVGLLQHLSGNRRNGLSRVRDRIARFAQSCA